MGKYIFSNSFLLQAMRSITETTIQENFAITIKENKGDCF